MSKSEKTRVRKPFLNYLPGIIAFVIPVFVMIVIFISRGIYPFGDRTFLRTDLYHQYAPFFQELKDKLSSGESLFYTWDIGLGDLRLLSGKSAELAALPVPPHACDRVHHRNDRPENGGFLCDNDLVPEPP